MRGYRDPHPLHELQNAVHRARRLRHELEVSAHECAHFTTAADLGRRKEIFFTLFGFLQRTIGSSSSTALSFIYQPFHFGLRPNWGLVRVAKNDPCTLSYGDLVCEMSRQTFVEAQTTCVPEISPIAVQVPVESTSTTIIAHLINRVGYKTNESSYRSRIDSCWCHLVSGDPVVRQSSMLMNIILQAKKTLPTPFASDAFTSYCTNDNVVCGFDLMQTSFRSYTGCVRRRRQSRYPGCVNASQTYFACRADIESGYILYAETNDVSQ